jgi:periplasmic protein TonB
MSVKTTKCNIKPGYLKYLLAFPGIFLLLFLFPAGSAAQTSAEQTPYVAVEEMPQFPGGDMALYKYISKNLHYPEAAKEKNIQGKVIIKFCVTPVGGISQISVLQGLNPDVDQEAIRVVKTLPVFTPGKKAGVPVPVWYLVPITFKYKEV